MYKKYRLVIRFHYKNLLSYKVFIEKFALPAITPPSDIGMRSCIDLLYRIFTQEKAMTGRLLIMQIQEVKIKLNYLMQLAEFD